MIVAFVGPSLPASETKGLRVLPPARQGDVWRAIELRPRAIALIDGVFESQPSVWHQEILDALDAGIPVVGGASMGALRAAELHRLGMRGVGRIFRWYRDRTDLDDSEVALLHAGAEHGFRPLTVPQVNVRWSAAKCLPRPEARALIEASGRIFYQERTLPRVLELVPQRWRGRFQLLDLKAEDARLVLRAARAARPRPVRRRRLLATRAPASAEDLAEAGLRRMLLAGWARELGLRASSREVASARRAARGQAPADELERLAEDVALERLLLTFAPRMLNDGPSAMEAATAELRLRRRRR